MAAPIRMVGVVVGALALAAGCGPKAPQVSLETARAAVYQGPSEPVLADVVAAVKAHYPNFAVEKENRVIKTAWHPLPLSEQVQTRENAARTPTGDGRPAGATGGGDVRNRNEDFDLQRQHRRNNTRNEKQFFVRFDVSLTEVAGSGGQRWQVRIEGFASAWDRTAAPELLRGGERPYWLDTRIEKLHAALYERLRARLAAPAAPASP